MWPRAYTVRPQAYILTVLSCDGAKGSSCRDSVLYKRSIGTGLERERHRPAGRVEPNRLAVDVHFDRRLARTVGEAAADEFVGRGHHGRGSEIVAPGVPGGLPHDVGDDPRQPAVAGARQVEVERSG